MALELTYYSLLCSGSNNKYSLAYNKTKWVSALEWKQCTLLDSSVSRHFCSKRGVGGRLAEFRAKDHPCLANCGADAARQMGLPRCTMCVTDTCGCVVLEAGMWCWSTAWGIKSHTHKYLGQFLCVFIGAFPPSPQLCLCFYVCM